MGLMRRAIAREEQARQKAMEEQRRTVDRFASTLVIAASIIAAVRLARDQDVSRPLGGRRPSRTVHIYIDKSWASARSVDQILKSDKQRFTDWMGNVPSKAKVGSKDGNGQKGSRSR